MDSIFETGFTFQSLPIQTYFPDFIIRYTIYYIVTAYLMHNKIFYLYNICLNISRLTDREPYVWVIRDSVSIRWQSWLIWQTQIGVVSARADDRFSQTERGTTTERYERSRQTDRSTYQSGRRTLTSLRRFMWAVLPHFVGCGLSAHEFWNWTHFYSLELNTCLLAGVNIYPEWMSVVV